MSKISFQAIRVQRSPSMASEAWAVERMEADGFKLIVSRPYATKHEAELEANKLNIEAARRTMS